SSRDLPKERLRSYSAYVLFYEKKETRAVDVTAAENATCPPINLLLAVEDENMLFLKERDLFSPSYGYALAKAVTNFVSDMESEEDLKSEEHVKMAVLVFKMFFDYCRNALWRLSYESREVRVFEMSVNAIRGLIRLSADVRQEFFKLIAESNYQLFYTMLSSPDDVCSAWWRLVGDALCSWLEDFDEERLPNSSVTLPQDIVNRIVTQIK
ncbi:hypothetical protein COOONC_20098, partial [Cooperia oncophora]